MWAACVRERPGNGLLQLLTTDDLEHARGEIASSLLLQIGAQFAPHTRPCSKLGLHPRLVRLPCPLLLLQLRRMLLRLLRLLSSDSLLGGSVYRTKPTTHDACERDRTRDRTRVNTIPISTRAHKRAGSQRTRVLGRLRVWERAYRLSASIFSSCSCIAASWLFIASLPSAAACCATASICAFAWVTSS